MDGLKLYLETLRFKNPQDLIKLVENKKYTAYEILCALTNSTLAMFLEQVPQLLEYTTQKERDSLMYRCSLSCKKNF